MGRTRTGAATGIVLDSGALIALDRGDGRMIALLQRALAQGRTLLFIAPGASKIHSVGQAKHISIFPGTFRSIPAIE